MHVSKYVCMYVGRYVCMLRVRMYVVCMHVYCMYAYLCVRVGLHATFAYSPTRA